MLRGGTHIHVTPILPFGREAENSERDKAKAATDAFERVLRGAAHTGAPRRALTCGAGAVA